VAIISPLAALAPSFPILLFQISKYFNFIFNIAACKLCILSLEPLISHSYFDKHETGQLIARATSDIDQTEMIFGMGFAIGLQSIFQISMVLISGFAVTPQLAWIIAVVFPISITCSFIIAFKMKPIFMQSRENFGEMTNTIRENLVGSQVVRMFGTQEKEKAKFAKNNDAFYRISIQSVKYSSMFMPLILLLWR
jgi:ATP-binding cassette subfamily B protein